MTGLSGAYVQAWEVVQIHEELVMPSDAAPTKFSLNIRQNMETVLADMLTSPEVCTACQNCSMVRCMLCIT